MPNFQINVNSSKSNEEIWNWIETNFEKILNRKVGFEKIVGIPNKIDQRIEFKGRTVKGSLTLKNRVIDFEIEVPLLYRSFLPHIKSALIKIFDQV